MCKSEVILCILRVTLIEVSVSCFLLCQSVRVQLTESNYCAKGISRMTLRVGQDSQNSSQGFAVSRLVGCGSGSRVPVEWLLLDDWVKTLSKHASDINCI